jgi:hypothetical protein
MFRARASSWGREAEGRIGRIFTVTATRKLKGLFYE